MSKEQKDEQGSAYLVRDPEVFARNLVEASKQAGQALSAYLGPRPNGKMKDDYTDMMTEAVKTFGRVSEFWLSDPQRAVEAQTRLLARYVDLWGASVKRLAGEEPAPVAEPQPGDNRFRDADWQDNPVFDFLKQMYLVTTGWLEEMVEDADVDDHTRQKADFYLKQVSSAVAPSNFLLTKPELLRQTVASNGENLARGMKMLAEDIEAGKGQLKIRQTDPNKFKVGENVAVSPGKVVAQNEICQVLQYAPATKEVLKRPLLIVPPWINKFYILDLNPAKSFIKWAVEQGHTVFVVSWVNPDERLAHKTFEDYMSEGVLFAVDTVEKATGEKGVNAIGYCVGGTLLAATLAYSAAKGDKRIKSATFFTAQVDFHHAGELKVFIDEDQLASLEKEMEVRGYLDGSKMSNAFNMLRPNDLIWSYVVNNYVRGKDPFPFDLLYWNSDSTRMTAANHAFYLRSCYLENKLSEGKMKLGGVKLDLKKITVPIYNLATREDHIAPVRSVFHGCSYFGGPVDLVVAGSGHIAGVVNPPDRGKYQFWVNGPAEGTLEDWLAGAEENPGSWWPHWDAWIKERDDTMVAARKPGGGKLKPIEDAPGSYVMARL